eukprot:Selendium_serpulae@DN5976_c0_g1_i5.p1
MVQYITTDMCDWVDGGGGLPVEKSEAESTRPRLNPLPSSSALPTGGGDDDGDETRKSSLSETARKNDKNKSNKKDDDDNCCEGSFINKWGTTAAKDGLESTGTNQHASFFGRLRKSSSHHIENPRLNPPTAFSNSVALFTGADEYGIRGLSALAGDVLQKYHLKRSNLVELWDVAQSCSYAPLKEACIEYMNRIPGSEIMVMLRK